MNDPLLLACPFPGCAKPIDGAMCPAHWSRVPQPLRRELLHELKRMRALGCKKPPPKMLALFEAAFAEIREVTDAVAQG